ncbi:amylo-alpha-1,6-glucosidase [Micromonospora pattaloongensis]|uniref:amylo-alpha-1,6-glucosidase n=1 Tax=Micromonospora pattaloongensis TaxID=405436 RepID=UPI000B86066E|nr:amylo-alpha-1,6-glucosidase [Micromonospora pattaloongensis]
MIEIGFGPQVCGDLAAGATREWLVTDGLGGYATGTVSGLRTRRYHGLLVVAGPTPATRRVALASLDPAVILPSGAQVRLGTHEWASGAVDPTGFELLERFDLVDGVPRWRWRIGDVVIERELAMAYGSPCVGVVHRLISGGPVELTLAAACTWRDAHAERYADAPPPRMEAVEDGAVIEAAYRIAGPGWEPAGQWWHGAHHREEAERGLQATEDLWYAGGFTGRLERPGDVVEVSAWAGELAERPAPAVELVSAARERSRAVVAAAKPVDAVDATLAHAADAFIVDSGAGPDVVAGYPWFGVWSRDTMIAYEGLLLGTGRAEAGRELLRRYAATLSEGMLANTADTGTVEYNTVDATLWFLHAVDRHVAATGDTDLAAELLPALRDVVAAHLAGTRYGIRVDPADGLLTQGAPGTALTWMDARVYGVPITPREGKPVEINALWVNGLAAVTELAQLVGADPGPAATAHGRAYEGFRNRFPAPGGWLYDVVDAPAHYPLGGDPNVDDDAFRPNQLLAWSLPYAPLEPEPGPLRAVAAALLTPLGLRSLAPGSPGYCDRHRGGPAQRDGAYHQGTVWPWLIGPYATACARASVDVHAIFTGLESHLTEFGLGSVSETADARPPHLATGCPFQAWSVAELLRARRLVR